MNPCDVILIHTCGTSQALIEHGEKGKESQLSGDKYESLARVGNLTIIFADTKLFLVNRTQASW